MTNRNWRLLKDVAAIGTTVIALHGATTRKWRRWHTVFVIAGAVATIGSALTERQTENSMVGDVSVAEAPSGVA